VDGIDAFVLHARPYRESSQLLEMLSEQEGRIGVLVRGSRGAKRSNPLQPFRRYRVVLAGRSELRRAQAVEPLDAPRLLAGHPLFAAIYLNELLVRLTFRDVPLPDVFALYESALDALSRGDALETTLRRFERALLDELGYGHRYGVTVAGEPVREGGLYTFDAQAGVREARPGSERERCYAGRSLLALEYGELQDDEALRDAKRLMRAALAPHLGDKPLNSRELFRPVRVLRTDDSGD
jgi:DNA repair protein RecO (recombination protein O)